MDRPILSICIPSYNRPTELKHLLETIDCGRSDIEIVIREDNSPKRDEIREAVNQYSKTSDYKVNYIENECNYGYDRNIRCTAQSATGKWIIFMGDDDGFVSHSLDKYIDFLEQHDEVGYVLRSYRNISINGEIEDYRYNEGDVFFEAGEDAIVELFRRSLFISGFTFKKDCFNDFECDEYDGFLLFQLYIMAVICKRNKSCYCDILITESYEGGTPYFGVSESEQELYTSGTNTVDGSLNFMANVKAMCESIDWKCNTYITNRIMDTYSRYSYGFLHEHREEGLKTYNDYVKGLRKLGFDRTYHFKLYYIALVLLGKNNCQKIIRTIKKRRGSTPKL